MDINQLKAFDYVVRMGSFSKAARYLNLSQPTISLRIQGLEKKVGGPLFQKVGKSLELSELGKGFLPYARQAMEILSKGVEIARHMQEGKAGKLSVGTLPTFTTKPFSEIIFSLYRDNPDIDIEIHTGHNQQIVDMLFEGQIKIGFITHPFFNTDIKKHLVLKEPLKLVAHQSNGVWEVLKEQGPTLNQIFVNSRPYIMVDWSSDSKQWQKNHMERDVETIELPPLSALDFISNGRGVALLTASMIDTPAISENIKILEHASIPEVHREIALVSLESEQDLSPVYKNFIELVREKAE